MAKTLVAFFSATGTTAKLAKTLAEAIDADIFEILPSLPYSKADLNWMNKKSRSSIEMNDPSSRPALQGTCANIADYDRIFIGFPIWWYVAPTIINTFLETHDFSGKTIITFATSGGSKMGETIAKLSPSCPGARLIDGRVFKRNVKAEELKDWAGSIA